MKDREGRKEIFSWVLNNIYNKGLSMDELNKIKDETIAPGWTVQDLVDTSIALGSYKVEDGLVKLRD